MMAFFTPTLRRHQPRPCRHSRSLSPPFLPNLPIFHHHHHHHHLLVVIVVLLSFLPDTPAALFRDCGGKVDDERGFIHSPNFPGRFPDPISCTWVLRAPPGRRIQLHFTQYFLREAFFLAEFDTYTSPTVFTGRNDLGAVDGRQHIRSVVGHKPVLSIEFRSWGKRNIHLRVEEFLTEVYGFNITYEMVPVGEPLLNHTCSVAGCSFLGHCYVTRDWREYYCLCFPGYYGSQCQYGPHCDPRAGRNMCLNGGSCRYFYGSYVNMCQCPPGFTGVQCETATNDTQQTSADEECLQLGCSQLCQKQPLTNRSVCSCKEGFRLEDDNVTCQLIELHRVTVDMYTADTFYTQQDVLSDWYRTRAVHQMNRLMQFYSLPEAQRFNIDSYKATAKSGHTLRFHFYTDSRNVDTVKQLFRLIAIRGRLFNVTLVYGRLTVRTSPELRLLDVENYEGRAAPEGSFSNLVCRARGSNLMGVRWSKDGRLVNTSLTTRNVWHTRIVEGEGGHTHMSVLNINDITIYDKGVFTCEVEDFGEVQSQEVTLDVVMSPSVVITPGAANARKGEAVSFRCFSPDERLRPFGYSWRKNGLPLEFGVDSETMEDVQPTGKLLTVPRALHPTNYTCVVTAHVISASSTVRMFVSDFKYKCEKATARGINWEPAVHGGYDVQKCPHPMHGLASRTCQCGPGTCTWMAPNFARCQTAAFIAVFDKTELLRLGYQGQSLADIYAELLSLLRLVSADDIIAGDVSLASRMIFNGMASAVDIPEILVQSETKIQPEVLLQLLSLLMKLSTKATLEERREQKILARSLLTMEMISELMESAMPHLNNGSFRDPFLVAEIKEYTHFVRKAKAAHREGNPASPLPDPLSSTNKTDTLTSNSNHEDEADKGDKEDTSVPRGSSENEAHSQTNNTRMAQKKIETTATTTTITQDGTGGSQSDSSEDPSSLRPTRKSEREPSRRNKREVSAAGDNALSSRDNSTETATENVRGGVSINQNGATRSEPSSPTANGPDKEKGFTTESQRFISIESKLNSTVKNDIDGASSPQAHLKNVKGHSEEGGKHSSEKSLTDLEDYIPAGTFSVLEVVHDDSTKLIGFPQRNDSQFGNWIPLTHMRSVLPIGGLWMSERYLSTLTFQHDLPGSLYERNETACFALVSYRHTLEQHWSGSTCQLIGSGTNVTTCLCPLPAHVAVFIRASRFKEQSEERKSVGSAVLLMGCLMALCAVSATFLCYLLTYRCVTSVFHVIRLNTLLALLALLALCVTCLQGRHLAILCLTSRLLLHLTLLGLFSFLFVDAIHMYIVVHSLSPRVLSERCCKFLAIGWGIPVLSVGSTAMTSSRYGHNDKCYVWCWVEPSTWQFYPFLVPMLVLVLACVLISAQCVRSVYSWTDEWRYRARKKQLIRTMKNGAILVSLLGVTWSGCKVDSAQGFGAQVAFVCLLFILVVVIFTSYCIYDKRVRESVIAFFRHRRKRLPRNFSAHSFRAFIMPEKIDDDDGGGGEGSGRGSREGQNIHRLCTQRDNKYTAAKKQQLRFLLGSSSGSSGSSADSGASGATHLRNSFSDAASGGDGVGALPPPRPSYNRVGGVVVWPGDKKRGKEEEEGGKEEEEGKEGQGEGARADMKADSGVFEKSSSSGGHRSSYSSSSRSGDSRGFGEFGDAGEALLTVETS
ncbi:uncharacterized protein LOC143295301 [Babylonia areolata]|uniref:uncharacterized protein LOC143295301 n=1 Tax=Babylonia areolata TaxID=304850 RepID=UPI003FD2ACB2